MRFRAVAIFLLLLILIYLFGPKPNHPRLSNDLPSVPTQSEQLEQYIIEQESLQKLKPDNEARIIWNNDTIKEKTEYAIVYLHGFSASQEEGILYT